MRLMKKESGFSLIEMMVAVGILGIFAASITGVFASQKRVYVSGERSLEVQEEARTIVDLIAAETRMGGFMVPQIGGISSVDGGVANPDRLCVSDFAFVNDETLERANTKFKGAQASAFVGNVITVNSTDIDADTQLKDPNGPTSTNDFVDNQVTPPAQKGAIVIDTATNQTWCAMLNTSTNTSVAILAAHAPPAGWFSTAANVVVVPATVYEIVNSWPAGCIVGITCRCESLPGTSNCLTRNGTLLASTIEDLQVQYWVDDQLIAAVPGDPPEPDGILNAAAPTPEFPVDNLDNPGAPGGTRDNSLIRRVQISVIGVSDQTDVGGTKRFVTSPRPANANRVAGVADGFRRKRFQMSVLPKNLLPELIDDN